MTECPDQRANQRRLAGAEVAFEENHQPRMQGRRQQGAQALGRGLVGQGENGGNIGAMHDLNSTLDAAALKDAIRQAGRDLGFAAIGFVAHVASLPTAFLIISVFLIGVAASGRLLKV